MKDKDFQFYVINLPIRENKNENIALYSEFFEFIFNRRKPIEIGGDKAAIIRTMTKAEGTNPKIYYGHMTSFTKVGKDWFNSESMERETYDMPKNLFANPKESYYFFIPKFHRFVLLKGSSGISLSSTMKFFNGLKSKMKKYEFDAHFEVSKDAINEILKAKVVKSLMVEFTYSNADIGSAAFKFVDKDLKKSNTESIKLVAKSRSDAGINIEDSMILKGGLELSQSYGHTEASIITDTGSKKVNTDDYPLMLKIKGNLGDFQALYSKIYNKLAQYLDK